LVTNDLEVGDRPVAEGARAGRETARRSLLDGRVPGRVLRGAGRVLLWAAGSNAQSHNEAAGMKTIASISPATQAEAAFAVRFSGLYLSWRPKGSATYMSEVDGLLASGLRDQAARVGLPRSGSGETVAMATVARSESLGSGRAIITVACSLSNGQVRYLAVPVAEDANGGLDVFARPALVAPPAAGRAQALSAGALPASEAAQVDNLVHGFLAAYLAGKSGGDLAGWIASGRVIAAMPLGLSLQRLESVGVVGRAHQKRMTVLARARVNDIASRAAYPLAYRLALSKDASGWRVAAVAGASS
jgi:hypothetical protein